MKAINFPQYFFDPETEPSVMMTTSDGGSEKVPLGTVARLYQRIYATVPALFENVELSAFTPTIRDAVRLWRGFRFVDAVVLLDLIAVKKASSIDLSGEDGIINQNAELISGNNPFISREVAYLSVFLGRWIKFVFDVYNDLWFDFCELVDEDTSPGVKIKWDISRTPMVAITSPISLAPFRFKHYAGIGMTMEQIQKEEGLTYHRNEDVSDLVANITYAQRAMSLKEILALCRQYTAEKAEEIIRNGFDFLTHSISFCEITDEKAKRIVQIYDDMVASNEKHVDENGGINPSMETKGMLDVVALKFSGDDVPLPLRAAEKALALYSVQNVCYLPEPDDAIDQLVKILF